LPGPSALGARLDQAEQVVERRRVLRPGVDLQHAEAVGQQVQVRVDQAGHCEPAAQIDDPCVGSDQRRDLGVAPGREHAPAPQRDSLHDPSARPHQTVPLRRIVSACTAIPPLRPLTKYRAKSCAVVCAVG
jgi:hypothetical protein